MGKTPLGCRWNLRHGLRIVDVLVSCFRISRRHRTIARPCILTKRIILYGKAWDAAHQKCQANCQQRKNKAENQDARSPEGGGADRCFPMFAPSCTRRA